MAIIKKNKNVKKIRILFVDSLNNLSSQLAEYYANQHYGDMYEVYSAGPKKDIIDCDLLSVMYQRGEDLRSMVSKDFQDTKRLPEDAEYDLIVWTEKEVFDELHTQSPWAGKQILADMGRRSEFEASDDVDLARCLSEMADRVEAWIKENLADPEKLRTLVSA
ncbi:MAG: hypothetical protein MJZ38_00465 [archaeon]|nr:hypothetical protein [archaeon]